MSRKQKARVKKPIWERGYNGHVYWLGKKKLGKVTVHADKNLKDKYTHKYTWEAAGRVAPNDPAVAVNLSRVRARLNSPAKG